MKESTYIVWDTLGEIMDKFGREYQADAYIELNGWKEIERTYSGCDVNIICDCSGQ